MKGSSIVVSKGGRFANQLFQINFARHIQTLVSGAKVLTFPSLQFRLAPRIEYYYKLKKGIFDYKIQGHFLSDSLSEELRAASDIDVLLLGWGMRTEYIDSNFLRNMLKKILNNCDSREKEVGSSILCHIRAGDIFLGNHRDYRPTPMSFYKLVQQTSNKSLKFLIEPNCPGEVRQALGETFGFDQILKPKSVAEDFALLFRAQETVISVSSFSWLASFLGNSSLIHYPRIGILDSRVRSDINLLPNNDNRFKVYDLNDEVNFEDNLEFFLRAEMTATSNT